MLTVRATRLLGGATVVLALGTGGALALVHALIQEGVQEVSAIALEARPGDPVLSLIAYVESSSRSLPARNRAVWVLGRLGDPRALPVLEKQYTGEACDHGRLLCQRELRKAIALCRPPGTP
jgi:HEAT repeat protein